MTRALQTFLIVGFFGAMMFFLFRDHVIPSFSRGGGIDVDRKVLVDTWVDSDDWMVVKLGKAPMGRMRTSAEAERADPTVKVPQSNRRMAVENPAESYTSASHLVLGPGLLRGRILSVMTTNRRLELETVRVRAMIPGLGQKLLSAEELDATELPPGAYELIGRVEGQQLLFRLRRDGAVKYGTLALPRPVTLADSISPILRGNMLTKDVTYAVDVYDPLMGGGSGVTEVEWVDNRIENVDGSPENVRIVEVRMQGMKTTLFVDQNGRVIRREIPLLTNQQGSEQQAVKGAQLIFERKNAEDARNSFPELSYLPEPRPVTGADVRGEDRGEVLQGMSAFGMMSGNLTQAFGNAEKGN